MWRGAALLLLCLVTFTCGLGRSAIQDSDEAYYAEAGREMLTGGDWTIPHYNFDVRLQKPILFYWVVAGAYGLAGVGEAAARIGAALSGIGLAFVAYFVTRRWIDDRAAWLAGAIVATGFGVVPIARQSLPDVPLAFFVSVACWCALEAVAIEPLAPGPAARAARRTWWLCVAAAASALGTLTKGPIAVVLPLAVVVPFVILERWRTARWPAVMRAAPIGAAVAVFVAVALPWYVAVVRAQGVGYLREFFIGENLDRFATAQNNSWRGYSYVPVIVFGLLPWSAFCLLWVAPVLRRLRAPRLVTPLQLRLACWALGPFAVLFVSIGSQPRYILPCLVPMAILLAGTISARARAQSVLRRAGLFTVSGAAAGAAIVAIGALFLHARPLLTGANPHWSSSGVVVLMIAGVVIAAGALAGLGRALAPMITLASAASVLVFELTILAPGRPEPVEVIAAAARAAGPVPAVCACGAFARSLGFYTHEPTVIGASDEEIRAFLDRPDRVLAAIDAGALARIEATRPAAFPRLSDVSYVNTGVWQRPATLLGPDLRYLQRVILISNR